MFPARAILARSTAHLRIFHSSVFSPQQQQPPDVPPPEPYPKDATTVLAEVLEDIESTHRGAAVTPASATSPRDIFNAWHVNGFYSPLAFLRSRRMRPPPSRPSLPTVGPGATESAHADVFRQLAIDPVHEANNQLLLSAFVTGMGKIRSRAFTRLSWRSQRKVAQAVKRAKQKGVIPILSRPRYYIPKRSSSNDK